MKDNVSNLAEQLDQTHLLRKALSREQKKQLSQTLSWLSSSQQKKQHFFNKALSPLKKTPSFQNKAFYKYGSHLIQKGKVACIILAGGEGSRLGSKKPKGCIKVYEKKSLFELIFDQIKEAQKKHSCTLPIGILTSSHTHDATCQFLQSNRYFGLKKSQILIFRQGNFSALTYPQEKLFLSKGEIAHTPNGNGGLLAAFHQKKVFNWFQNKTLKYIQIVSVDNPLADPFDPYLIGFQYQKKYDVGIQCFERTHKEESLGILFQNQKNICIRDYFELDPKLYQKKQKNMFYYPYANAGHYSFAFSFLKTLKNEKLPIHWVKKKTTSFGPSKWIWKAEIFLFDALQYARSSGALCYPKEECYAPLKQKEGPNGLNSLRKAIKTKYLNL